MLAETLRVMILRYAAAFLAFATIGAAPQSLTVYSAPAGDRPAGIPDAVVPYDAILPNGRIVAPIGANVVVGMNALGVALSPDGRYAIVTNNDERDAGATSSIVSAVRGGYSIAVVDTARMQVTDVYARPNESFFLGVAALRDPANLAATLVLASGGASNDLHFLRLDAAGHLNEDGVPLGLPLASDPRYANSGHAFPGSISLSSDHRTAYVVNNLANTVSAVDIGSRRVLQSVGVGYFPYAAAIAAQRLYVTNAGLSLYGKLSRPIPIPRFATVNAVPSLAAALTAVPLDRNGNFAGTPSAIAMDRGPDPVENVGGAQPTAIAVSKTGRYAYVCMTNVDRVATVDLLQGRVAGGIQLRLFDRAPFGTQPDAIARSPDGTRLYVALAGINAIAVLDARDPVHLHRLGLIPTGWYPSGIAVSPTGRFLYVTNAKGFGHEARFEGGPGLDSNTIWATLQRIDLHKLPLLRATLSALRYTRTATRAVNDPIVPPLRSLQRSSTIRHVVFILEENKTYDSMLGDLTDAQGRPYGNGDPSLASFGAAVTPNLHALALEYALATNLYADAEESDAGHQFAAAGIATAYSEKTLLVKNGRYPMVNKNEDPEDYPRAGYIFNAAARARLSYRDYGDLIRLSGYDEGNAAAAHTDDPNFSDVNDALAPTSGLGGLYSLDVPALEALGGHIDLNYPGWNLRIRDVRRANEFIRDYGYLERQGQTPDLAYVWLPNDHGGAGPNIPPLPEEVADGDRALGMIVDFLTHQPSWNASAIFITPDDAQSSRDHVNEHRTYAVVVSPFARRRSTGAMHLSTVSILKTEEELLGLPGLSLGDLLATDMAQFFTPAPDYAPYSAIPVPVQRASIEGQRIAQLLLRTDQSAPDADVERSARIIDLSRRADALALRRSRLSSGAHASAERRLYQEALQTMAQTDGR